VETGLRSPQERLHSGGRLSLFPSFSPTNSMLEIIRGRRDTLQRNQFRDDRRTHFERNIFFSPSLPLSTISYVPTEKMLLSANLRKLLAAP